MKRPRFPTGANAERGRPGPGWVVHCRMASERQGSLLIISLGSFVLFIQNTSNFRHLLLVSSKGILGSFQYIFEMRLCCLPVERIVLLESFSLGNAPSDEGPSITSYSLLRKLRLWPLAALSTAPILPERSFTSDRKRQLYLSNHPFFPPSPTQHFLSSQAWSSQIRSDPIPRSTPRSNPKSYQPDLPV